MSATVSSRRVEKRVLTFGFDSRVRNNNLLLYDEETHSLWSQLSQQAIQGTLVGTPLQLLPCIQTSWAHWRSLFPHTRVVEYRADEFLAYRYPPLVHHEPENGFSPEQRRPDQLVLGVTVDGRRKAYPFFELAQVSAPVEDQVGRREISVHYNSTVPAAWVTDSGGELLASVTVFWIGWRTFYPDTDVFVAR